MNNSAPRARSWKIEFPSQMLLTLDRACARLALQFVHTRENPSISRSRASQDKDFSSCQPVEESARSILNYACSLRPTDSVPLLLLSQYPSYSRHGFFFHFLFFFFFFFFTLSRLYFFADSIYEKLFRIVEERRSCQCFVLVNVLCYEMNRQSLFSIVENLKIVNKSRNKNS